MSSFLQVALLVALAGGPPSDLTRIELALRAERSDYSLGEPVRLTMTARNGSDQRIAGYFHPAAAEQVTLLYRRDGESFQPLQRPKRIGHAIRIPSPIPPGEEETASSPSWPVSAAAAC